MVSGPLRRDLPEELVKRGLCSWANAKGSQIETDAGLVFVKEGTGGASADLATLQCEAMGLERLREAANGEVVVPKVWAVGTLHSSVFLAMEYVEAGGPGGSRALGKGLATIHLAPHLGPFGFPVDGQCGAATQPNNAEGREMNWVEFWREFRLGHQLHLARQQGPDRELEQLGAELTKRLPELFSGIVVEDIQPSLLHGDLWSGNCCTTAQTGLPCIFDPAPYYGHHEADLGIARMFGGFSSGFWSSYHSRIPKADGYERRALLYELHHHLNHMNIFGGGYRSGCISLMKKILNT